MTEASTWAREPHDLNELEFLREVHSFNFWFEAVGGYLEERPFGYDPELADPPMDPDDKDRLITTLCNYCIGEKAALEASSGLIRLAPNEHSQIFLATQVVDEARHVEVFMRRLEQLGVEDPETEIAIRGNAGLQEFRSRLTGLVDRGDWEAAVFAQNVLLESMEDTVFRFHASVADPITQQMLQGIVADERRHLGFGENTLGRALAGDSATRQRLADVKMELDPLVLESFQGVYRDLGLTKQTQPELGRHYLDAVSRLGLTA